MNTLIVAKFGGTSMADFTAMNRCADIVIANPSIRLVVVSAASGITNQLLALVKDDCSEQMRTDILSQIRERHNRLLAEITAEQVAKIQLDYLLMSLERVVNQITQAASEQLLDELLSFGELFSSLIFVEVLRRRQPQCELFDARTVIQTDSRAGRAEPQVEQIKQMADQWLAARLSQNVVVTQGFIGSDDNGRTTTLGRGGSDYSAALFAEALDAAQLQIWTDVDGIYTTDPRIAPQAQAIREISFDEAAELATFGAKILHPLTLWPAIRKGINVFVGSSWDPQGAGTWIKQQVVSSPSYRAIAVRQNQTLVTVTSLNMLHSYGFLANVFEVLARHKISVDLVTTSEVSVALTLDVIGSHIDAKTGLCLLQQTIIDELSALGEVKINHGLALVAIVGNGIDQQAGVSGRIFSILAAYNLRLICHGASGHNICMLVEQAEANDVVCTLHRELFEAV